MRLPLPLIAAGLALATVTSVASAAPPAPEISAEADHLAARGYDVTAYFTDGKAVRGRAEFSTEYKGATWRFASADAKAKFLADPAAFAPQFGGYCSWAVSQNYVAPGDPEQWKIVGGKLYLNFNARAKELWEADQDAAIERGNANWPTVLSHHQN
ncbi:YHS domain-containing (seleno)protein [Sphingomonas jaspsi]|uniref:YHS domain-containing (seleno)protein n=1 Tax=Sphingomonas jaspsi TaxID=392409 RepID=UPI0004BAAB24|nr:YHS domain-containing (seleno)protein [Sphingomonas jaspsi]